MGECIELKGVIFLKRIFKNVPRWKAVLYCISVISFFVEIIPILINYSEYFIIQLFECSAFFVIPLLFVVLLYVEIKNRYINLFTIILNFLITLFYYPLTLCLFLIIFDFKWAYILN